MAAPYSASSVTILDSSGVEKKSMSYPPSSARPSSSRNGDPEDIDRGLTRTPSPTPSEQDALDKSGLSLNFRSMMTTAFWQPRRIAWTAGILVMLLSIILFIVFKSPIVRALHPATQWVHDQPAGWLIPIALLIVLSFPPAFGHELVAILCGVTYGIGIGFGVVAAGTFLGEIANFYVFRHWFKGWAARQEETKISYACMAKVIREGGFKIALISRYSIIPGHVTTAIYSTSGIDPLIFAAAAFLSLPKNLVLIVLGTVAAQGHEHGHVPAWEQAVNAVFIIAMVAITVPAWMYMLKQVNRVKPQVIYERRKSRQVGAFQTDTSVMVETV